MCDMYFDVDTALTAVPVNKLPLLDATDFKTIEDAVAYNAAGLALFWNFVTSAGARTVTAVTPTTAGVYDWTDHGTSGMYSVEMPASGGASANNDTEGYGWFTGVATGVLPWCGPVIGFRAAAINDALMDGGDYLQVDILQVGGVAEDIATETKQNTAQADLDLITGADGATLATAQPSITFQPMTITAGDAIANLTFAGTGSADGLAFTRSGSGNPFDAEFAAQIQSECNDAIVAYDPATGTEVGTLQTSVNDLPTNAELATALDALPTAAENATAVLTTQMTESYRAAGAAPTLAQAQFETIGHLGDSSISGTTKTVRNLAGTAAKTYTLDDATTPTSITEAT